MNSKDDNIKIEFLKKIKKGISVKQAAEEAGISYKTALAWSKKWHLIRCSIIETAERLANKLKEETLLENISAHRVLKLTEALKNLENNLFTYQPYNITDVKKENSAAATTKK